MDSMDYSPRTVRIESSALTYATKNGWQISPTIGSENARQQGRTKDGECSSRVFLIASRITQFPETVIRENITFKMHTIIFEIKPSSEFSKLTCKNEHDVGRVWFMITVTNLLYLKNRP